MSVSKPRWNGAGAMAKSDLEDTCQFFGFKATQDGLLSGPELRKHLKFIDVLRYDWAHTFLADSLVGREMWAIIAAGKREGLFDERSVFELLSKPWLFPGRGQSGRKSWSHLKSILCG